MEVAVAGGLRGTGVTGQAVPAATIAEPAQDQHCLAERAERVGTLRGADPTAVGGQQPCEELHDMARDVECGGIGNQREASGCCGHDLVVRPVLPGASRLPAAGHPLHEGSRRELPIPPPATTSFRKPHCRCTPTVAVPFVTSPVSSATSTTSRPCGSSGSLRCSRT